MWVELQFQQVWEQSASPSMKAGTIGRTPDGRLWRYVQASVALSAGNVCVKANNTGIAIDADVDAAAAADTIRVTGTGDFTATALEDADYESGNNQGLGHQYFLWIDAGGSQGQGGIVTSRVSDNVVEVYWVNSDDGKISTALTTASDYVVMTDARVAKSSAATQNAVCVAQIAVTDEYWFWGLYFGKGIVLFDTDDNPVKTTDLALIPSASTAGYSQGTTASGATAGEALCVFGRTYIDQTADGLILFNANCMWTDPSTNILLPTDVAFGYPKMFRQ